MMTTTTTEWMTTREVAGVLNCSPTTVRRLIEDGEFSANQFGGRYIVKREVLAAYIVRVSGFHPREEEMKL
jgi:excisionase family DNA binding protein